MSYLIVSEDGCGEVVEGLEVFGFAFVAELDPSKMSEAGKCPFHDVSNFAKTIRQADVSPTRRRQAVRRLAERIAPRLRQPLMFRGVP